MNLYAIIVAGGTGSRIGKDLPKQFLPIAGKPLLMHSIQAFAGFDPGISIIVSLHPDWFSFWESLCREYGFEIPHQLVAGGNTRYQSVKNGLATITGNGLVAVHDAARPVLKQELLKRVYHEAGQYSSAIPFIPVYETVRRIHNNKVTLVDRSELRICQTPQVFELELLRNAYRQEYIPTFTDDASLIENMGIEPHLTEGDPENIKITLPGDLRIAELLLGS